MPKTTFQRVIFTIIGVIFMATTMATYNKYLAYVDSSYIQVWSADFWKQVGIAFCQKAPLAFVLQFFVVQKLAGKFAAKHKSDNDIVNKCIRVGATATIMAPIMCVYSNIILWIQMGDKWTFVTFITNIITKLPVNWIFAFFIQVVILKDLVGVIFRLVFFKQFHGKKEPVSNEAK